MSGLRPAWQGGGFLTVANGVDPARMGEYENWHSFEHVPERLTLPGFLAGKRYVGRRGDAWRYLTVYDLDSVAVVETAAYQHLLANPTPASLTMRPAMTGFQRELYRDLVQAGAGLARHLGHLRWNLRQDRERQDIATLAAWVGKAGVTSLRVGASQETAAHPAFVSSDAAPFRPHAVALIGATDEHDLSFVLGALAVGMSGAVFERSIHDLILAY